MEYSIIPKFIFSLHQKYEYLVQGCRDNAEVDIFLQTADNADIHTVIGLCDEESKTRVLPFLPHQRKPFRLL